MRCFVAVETPDDVRRELGQLQRELRPGAPGVRWVRPEQMHLTLAFLGEVDERFLDAAREPLAGAVAGRCCFTSRLAGLGAFGSPARARVLWVGMDHGRDEVIALEQAVSSALASVGFLPEGRPFSPHLTLGRLREPADVTVVTARQFTSVDFTVGRVALFESELRPEGPRYTERASFPLGLPA